MRSTRFRSHHHVNGREKRSCNLLTYTLVAIVLLNISIVASAQQRSTFAILTRISNRKEAHIKIFDWDLKWIILITG